MRSDAILARLGTLHPKLIDLSLDRVAHLLHRLGDPQEALPPVVHVAGTNGKGSVVAFLRAILEAAGLRVHAYTSPHLVRFHERIRVAGRLIDDATLADLLAECEGANEGGQITFFEITTAAAFLAFARAPADVTLLETGLGGRLDATNVIARPALTALTPISMDHQAMLGDDIEAILREKAGILKPGVPCVVARPPRRKERILDAEAGTRGAPLLREGEHWGGHATGDALLYRGPDRAIRLPRPGLPGPHQIHNAAQAVACAEALGTRLGLDIPEAALARGLLTVDWPARLQRLAEGPLVGVLPDGWELWLDGGHNPAAGVALATHARRWRDRPLHLILGMMASKDVAGFLDPFRARTDKVRCVAIPGEAQSLSAADLAETARRLLFDAAPAASVAAALDDLARGAERPARVLICGSLYLAGDVLRANGGISDAAESA